MRFARLLLIALMAAGFSAAHAQPVATPVSVASPDGPLGIETYRLWPGRAPQATSDNTDEVPVLTLFRPAWHRDNGAAVIVAPGGGYVGLSAIQEGRDAASWFAAHGITAFVLTYRVGAKARLPIPLLDGARAVRFVRANAPRWHIADNRIGMIGFSAGGHLAASVAGLATAGDAAAPDPVERAGSRPDFVVLAYPWLEATTIDAQGHSFYCRLAHDPCKPADYAAYRPADEVADGYPPTFIYHTTTDNVVRPGESVAFYEALVAHHVPVEMHIFANGPHGTGLGGGDPALSHWPELLAEWLRALGTLPR